MPQRSADGDAFSSVAVHILYINSLLIKKGDQIAAVAGQTSARWRALACLEEESKTVASIAKDLGLARQSVQRIADSLAEERLVSFAKNPKDQRTDLVNLTATGLKALRKIQKEQTSWANDMAEKLGRSSLRYIEASLEKLSEALAQSEPMSEI